MFVGVGAFLLLLAVCPIPADRESVFKQAWDNVAIEYLRREGGGCRGCAKVREELIGELSEVNLTDIRIEIAKQQILRKLGLVAAPKPPKRASLPFPIIDGSAFKKNSDKEDRKKTTITTERIVNFASDVNCSVDSLSVNLRIKFELNGKMRGHLLYAALWLYLPWLKISNGLLSSKPCGTQSPNKMRPIYLQPPSNDKAIGCNYIDTHALVPDGWIEKNVTWMLQEKESCYSFKVAWSGENLSGVNCSVYTEPTKKPFITAEVVTDDGEDVTRPKRNVDCFEGVTDCCREKLYISFSQIGWSDWIVRPKGYDAYYCKGTCSNAASIALGGGIYHSVMKKVYLTDTVASHITPCCTPVKMSAAQIIYRFDNGTVTAKYIPDMTVDSCGCM